MAFQVREFEFNPDEQEFVWSFKLANINTSQLDFYSQQASTRSLLHLAQDLVAQVDQTLQKKHKKAESKDRVIRKLCEKMLKELRINLPCFAEDVMIGVVRLKSLLKRCVFTSISFLLSQLKCSGSLANASGGSYQAGQVIFGQAIMVSIIMALLFVVFSMQLALPPSQFYNATRRYMHSYIQDGKRTNPDFQMLNELYAVTLGDNFTQLPDVTKNHNESLVLIDINLNIDDKYISQNFLWDSQDVSNIRIRSFASHFLRDTLVEHGIELEKEALQDLQKDTKIQIRTQILYKSLLKKYAGILLNFSSMDIPSEVKQYTIPIALKLLAQNGSTILEDEFEWDILNESNNVQQFVGGLVEDYELPNRYRSQLCYKIRSQINSQLQRKFDLLVKTFKSIHRDRQSPKLNTQTISVLRKNVTFAMDVSLPCTDQKYSPNSYFYFNNSDLFSLLSRNIDILPEEFQEILMCRENKNSEKQTKGISKLQSNQLLKKHGQNLENNPYLSAAGSNYNIHSIWRKALSK